MLDTKKTITATSSGKHCEHIGTFKPASYTNIKIYFDGNASVSVKDAHCCGATYEGDPAVTWAKVYLLLAGKEDSDSWFGDYNSSNNIGGGSLCSVTFNQNYTANNKYNGGVRDYTTPYCNKSGNNYTCNRSFTGKNKMVVDFKKTGVKANSKGIVNVYLCTFTEGIYCNENHSNGNPCGNPEYTVSGTLNSVIVEMS